MKPQVMTPDHPHWEAFFQRLEGPEGCHFQGEYDNDGELVADSVKWECAGGEDKSKATAILKTMPEIDMAASLAFFEQHGGWCDCEIVFNVENNFQAKREKSSDMDVSDRASNGSG